MTDLTKWKLHVNRGRQVWKYHPDQKPEDQKFYDRYHLGLNTDGDVPEKPKPKDLKEALRNAIEFHAKLQTEDGHWSNDYGGPLFLLPGLIITCYITKTEIPEPYRLEMIRYISTHQREDGGWGLHIESESTNFGTSLNYCSLRLLGVGKDDERCVRARKFLHSLGGPLSCTHWGKFWLATLGVFDWEGINAVLPELWLLPFSLPIHPGRFWCHCRVIYLPMAYLYGRKAVGEITPLVKELREELYPVPYDKINWKSARFQVSERDLYKKHSWVVKTAFPFMNFIDKWIPSFLRNKALYSTLDHIRYEDYQTRYIDIGPVNKAFDMLCEYFGSNGESKAFKLHQERIFDYLWLASDGMKMQGYNGCQLWDTAFTLQAYCEAGEIAEEFAEYIKKGYEYVDITQVRENSPESNKYFRHISKGAWPFSTKDHGWPISDCTGEGFRASVLVPRTFKFVKRIDDDRLFDALNVMLSLQNPDGGWASYELQRSGGYLEYLNPAESFDGIMVDYPYVECSSSVIQSLIVFRQEFPNHRRKEVDTAIKRGIEFIKKKQREDGSWHGSWAVCYTYAIWFGVTALHDAGEKNCKEVIKACEFLRSKQKEDGSWGEDFKSCVNRYWVEAEEGHVVQTSWALLSLMLAEREEDKDAVKKGILWLINKQLRNGDWKLQQIVGVFNFNCAISYEGYKNYFSIWALAKYLNRYKYGGNIEL